MMIRRENEVYLTRKLFFKRIKRVNYFIQSFLKFVISTHLDVNVNEKEDGFSIKYKSARQLKQEKEMFEREEIKLTMIEEENRRKIIY